MNYIGFWYLKPADEWGGRVGSESSARVNTLALDSDPVLWGPGQVSLAASITPNKFEHLGADRVIRVH